MGQRLDLLLRGGADMKIEAGKYYRTRGGQVFGPMVMDANPEMVYPLRVGAASGAPRWTDKGAWHYGRPSPFDLVAEVYVSDTPPDAKRETEAELREMMRDPRYWRTREPEYVMRVTEGFRTLVGGNTPPDAKPAPEAKTLRDEFAMRLMDRGAFAVGYIDEAEQLYRAADAMMEARKK